MKPIVSISFCLIVLFASLAVDIEFSYGATEWWNSAWSYRKQITLSETNGYSLVQFPVKVTFAHFGKTQPNGNDIRIINDVGAEVPYSLEEINSTHATVIFETDLLPLSLKNYTIYYGNKQADAPNYPLIPLNIFEGNTGNATVDNRVFLGWANVAWGAQPGFYLIGGSLVYVDNNPVTLWNDFRIDSNGNGVFEQNEDMLTDLGSWIGGIGRSHTFLPNYVERSYGLGDYIKYIRNPVYVDLVFANAKLRVYKGQNFVETDEADRLHMEGSSWDYANYKGGTEENIIDGLNTNGPTNDPTWNILYNSTVNPSWMAYRNSMTGCVIGAIGFNTNSTYSFMLRAKESHAFDRLIYFDWTDSQTQNPYDQPSSCHIYWYADYSNSYSNLDKASSALNNPPSVLTFAEESLPTIPEFPRISILSLFMYITGIGALIFEIRQFKKRTIRSHVNTRLFAK